MSRAQTDLTFCVDTVDVNETPPSDSAVQIYRGDTGAAVWLDDDRVHKVHRRANSYLRERDNYRALSKAGFSAMPKLLVADDERKTLVLERIVPWDELSASEEAPVLRHLGKSLAELHAIEAFDIDAMPLEEAFQRRVGSAVRAIEESDVELPERLRTLATDREVYREFAGCQRRWCHRDFRPQNWGQARDSDTVLIMDWEHARPDLPAVDFARLHTKLDDDSYRQLCAGYAETRELPSRTHRRFAVMLHILQTLRWSLAHGDDKHLAEVDALLAHPEWWDYSQAS
jgi:hypothetical protein